MQTDNECKKAARANNALSLDQRKECTMSVASTQARQARKTEKMMFTGLCSTCNNAEHCNYALRASEPVTSCEMFDAYTPEPATAVISEVLKLDPADLRPTLPDAKGLCVNCANRETCIYAKREGGVWHCEEYR